MRSPTLHDGEASGAGLPWAGSERDQARYPRTRFWLHLRPARVRRASMRWSHTMGLGGSTLVLLLLLLGTGLLQLLVYQPSLDGAWPSVRALETSVGFGSLVRGVHYWSANLLLLVVGLHVARVLFTGAFGRERRVNWWIGLGLLLAILASSFTGYLLPLDQRAWWAVTVSTRMLDLVPVVGPALSRLALGAETIEGTTLVRFTTFHTSLLPLVLAGLGAWHFWRVRRAGGVIPPPGSDAADRLNFFPHLFVRELAQAALLVALVTVLAVAVAAPLGDPANPGLSPNPVKAPWYFVGLQELLVHVHPLVALVLLPGAVLLGAVLLPRWAPADGGRWFLGPPHRRVLLAAMVLALAATPMLVVLSDRAASDRGGLVAGFLVPVAVLVGLFGGGGLLLRWRWHPPRQVLALAGVGAVIAIYVALTIVGQFFRGQDMALVWPG